MAKKFRYRHINSTVEDKTPQVLLAGEIAVNRYADKEKLFIQNTNNQMASFSSDTVIDGKLANKASKLEDLDGIKLKKITRSAYNALVQAGTVDANTLYFITG